jgi:hypothetical protein
MRVITKAILNIETMKWTVLESYDYDGAVDLCCGPSSEMEQQASGANAWTQLLAGNYSQRYGQQSQVLGNLQSMLTPISMAGPDQGIGAPELTALNTQVGQQSGENYAKAAQTLNMQQASRGGGNEYLPTGAAAAQKEQLASASANDLGNKQFQVSQYSQDVGRQNWTAANAGLQQLGQQYSPNASMTGATSAGDQAFSDANQIQTMKNQEQGAIAGMITGAAVDAGTFGAGAALGYGGSSGIAGGLNALKG